MSHHTSRRSAVACVCVYMCISKHRFFAISRGGGNARVQNRTEVLFSWRSRIMHELKLSVKNFIFIIWGQKLNTCIGHLRFSQNTSFRIVLCAISNSMHVCHEFRYLDSMGTKHPRNESSKEGNVHGRKRLKFVFRSWERKVLSRRAV